jgi:dTDP-4-amino-4,6-dideoxygalactose transaminase
MGFKPTDEVLVPAYHYGADVESLRRVGLTCRFYDVSLPALEPSEEELESLLGPRTRALLLIHYLGFPQAATRWRHWCDHRNLLLIENCAQAWQARRGSYPVGASGHLALFAPYKSLGLSHGSILLTSMSPEGTGGAAVEQRRFYRYAIFSF